MRRFIVFIGCWFLLGQSLAAEVPVLVYHDISDVTGTDDYAVTSHLFREQMAFLKQQGYQPVSLARFADAAAGKSMLPEKPIVLSFDDGLVSFRVIAMPVLQAYGFPAVLSVVTGWVDGRQVPADYRGRLLTWEQLRAISRSPLVEILSHSDNLHHGILANPQGNLTSASITRRYAAAEQRYESEADYRARIHADLAHSAQRLKAELGKSPPGIAWPYGDYNQVLAEEATALGMRYQLTLDKGPARTEQFPRINRIVLRATNTIASFENALNYERARSPLRILEIELDDMAGAPATVQEKWLSALLNRLTLLRANAVLVNPFTRDGRQAFYKNEHVPLRAEVLHRVLTQIRTRAGIDYLLLRIPAIPSVAQAAMELARRHPYDGVLLAAGLRPAAAAMLQKQFNYFRPGSRCGREQGAKWPVCKDFMAISVELSNVADNPVVVRGAPPTAAITAAGSRPVIFLLNNRSGADGKQAVGVLHKLRSGGAQNYGLRDGQFLEEPENLRRVAAELAGHSRRGVRY